MSLFKIQICDFPSLATRESGQLAREAVLKRLETEELIVLDFADAKAVPRARTRLVFPAPAIGLVTAKTRGCR